VISTFSAAALLSRSLGAAFFAASGNQGFADALPAFREKLGAIPILSEKLSENMTLLSGPGGNVLVLNGKDGKVIIDTFVKPAWPRLQKALYQIGPEPIKLVIDTHWHFDHTDNNEAFHTTGAPILAHERVPRRLSEDHNIQVLHFHFPALPHSALPTQTFADTHFVSANGEKLRLQHVRPAHTDGDVFIRFEHANVIHCGDLVINNGGFPLIDIETGGNIPGMIEASNRILAITDGRTRIVPGHGSVADKATLIRYRDMLSSVHDRVAGLKAQGKSLDEAIAAKPLDFFLKDWGAGLLTADQYTELTYSSL